VDRVLPRKKPTGLDVGGTWVIPERSHVEPYELALILEVPEGEIRAHVRCDDAEGVPVRQARDFLKRLAAEGLADSKESGLFAALIAGRRLIDRNGDVFVSHGGRALGGAIDRRSHSGREEQRRRLAKIERAAGSAR
jgi:hypothetical protein